MIQKLADFVTDAPIFVDANIFLFHVFDDEKHGKAATSFLTRIENEETEALTSSLVVDEVFFKILVQEAAAYLKRPTFSFQDDPPEIAYLDPSFLLNVLVAEST